MRPRATAVSTRRRHRQALDRVGESASRRHERHDTRSRSRQSFAIGGWRCLKDLGRFVVIQFDDLAEDIRQSLVTVQTLQHCQSAPDLDLLQHQLLIDVVLHAQRIIRQPTGQILAELIKAQSLLLHSLLAQRKQGVAGNTIYPGPKPAFSSEADQAGEDSNEDLLGCVLCVLGVPEEAQSQVVNVFLHGANHKFQGSTVSGSGPSDFEFKDWHGPSGRELIHAVRVSASACGVLPQGCAIALRVLPPVAPTGRAVG